MAHLAGCAGAGKGKASAIRATEKPSARWVSQLFVGIHVQALPDRQKMILNLDETHRNIIDLFSNWNFNS